MKILYYITASLIVFCSQVYPAEQLDLEGVSGFCHDDILECYLESRDIHFDVTWTGPDRSYKASWEIKESKLFMTSLVGYDSSVSNALEILFKEDAFPVEVTWFSGDLEWQTGTIRHRLFGHSLWIADELRILKIKDGIVVSSDTYTYPESVPVLETHRGMQNLELSIAFREAFEEWSATNSVDSTTNAVDEDFRGNGEKIPIGEEWGGESSGSSRGCFKNSSNTDSLQEAGG